MKRILLLVSVILFINNITTGQGTSCNTATPFCTGTLYNYPAGVNTPAAPPSASPGPNYGCLGAEPNPTWQYLQVNVSGNIELFIHGSGNQDIDFCCWGPFIGSQTAPCLAGLTAGSFPPSHHAPGPSSSYPTLNMIDCSYSASDSEWCYIPNAINGQYYIILMTNYSNQPQNITFLQTNIGQVGAGTTQCGILAAPIENNGPLCAGDTLKLTALTIPNASYFWSGPGGWSSTLQNPTRTNVTAAMSGNYTCSIIIGTQISAEDTTNVTIGINLSVNATPDTVCPGKAVVLRASGAGSYKWIPSNSTSNPYTIYPNATTTYKLLGTIKEECFDSINFTINVNPLPQAHIKITPHVASTDNPVIGFNISSLSANVSNWQWNFGDYNSSTNTSQLNSIFHTYSGAGMYTIWLKAESDKGCRDSVSGRVYIERPYGFNLPDDFYPGNPYLNISVYKAMNIETVPSSYNMIIYDKIGRKVFETTDINKGWNGRTNNNGDILPSGIYVYYVRFTQPNGIEKELSGHLTMH